MQGISNCELCGVEFHWRRFKNQTLARFCCKKCWYEWNAKNLSAFNEKRFQWKTATEEEKFQKLKENYEKYVVRKDGCWKWTGVKDKDGYGQLPVGYHKQGKAHRISWLIYKGEITKGMIICHKCDNPSCTNPEHLFLGTIKINNDDSRSKNRAAVGSKQPGSKLKEEDIKEIRKLISIGVTGRRIAQKYGVAPSQICNIKNNRSWKHVKEEI